MNMALRVLAGVALGIASLLSIPALIAIASDSREVQAEDARILVMLIGLVLFAGILWLLTDIARSLDGKTRNVGAPDREGDGYKRRLNLPPSHGPKRFAGSIMRT